MFQRRFEPVTSSIKIYEATHRSVCSTQKSGIRAMRNKIENSEKSNLKEIKINMKK
jgi:hypothetical protein